MAPLSISQAWNEAGAFLRRELRLVAPVALLLIAIPGFAAELLAPPDDAPLTLAGALTGLVLVLLTAFAGLIATIAITALALQPGLSVGEALALGLRRCGALFLASFLIGVGFGLLAMALLAILQPDLLRGPWPVADTMTPGALTALLLLMLVAVACWVRFMMMTPVATVEPAGPLAIIRRSWRLTAGHFWKLLGLVLLLLLVAVIVMMAVGAAIGLVLLVLAGPPLPGSASWAIASAVSALFQTAFAVLLVTLVARLYVQLRGTGG